MTDARELDVMKRAGSESEERARLLTDGNGSTRVRAALQASGVRPGTPESAVVKAAGLAESGCLPCAQKSLHIAQRRGLDVPTLTRAVAQYPVLREIESVSQVLDQWASEHGSTPTASRRRRRQMPDRFPDPPGYKSPQFATVADKLAYIRKLQKEHVSSSDPNSFGIDSCTHPSESTNYGIPVSFYIGEMGWGTNAGCSCGCCFCSGCTTPPAGCSGAACFFTDSASYVGITATYGYWGLIGPNCNASGLNMHDWGASQGNWAYSNWLSGPWESYIYGGVIFCDVESGFGGWPGSQTDNASVLDGFLDALAAQGLTPGVYINSTSIIGSGAWFAPSYVPTQPFVFWGVGNWEGIPPCVCPPCASCPTEATVENDWNSAVVHGCFGNQGMAIWQYAPDCPGCPGDFNYSPQSPTGFTPVGCS
jgi:hypothetical protein